MKFLVLETDPRFGGGCEAFALELTKALAQRGHEMVLGYEIDDTMLPTYRRYVVDVWQTRLPPFGWRTLPASLACVRRIGKYCRANNIQAIVTSHLSYLRTLALVRTLYRIKTVYHLGLPLTKCSFSMRRALKRMAAGVAPSEPTANAWRQCRWPEKRLHVVPNWVDTARFVPCEDRAARRRMLRLDERTPLVLYVGRITAEKGIETLVRAFAGSLKFVPEAKLVLVGTADDEYRKKIDELAKQLGLTPQQVLWQGTTDRPEHYQSVADVIAVPSQWEEPFGLVLIESMACAALTITSSAGILPQIIGEQNRDLVFPAGDVKALEARIAWWLKHPVEAAVRGNKLRERTMTAFSPTRGVDVYERLLVEAGGGQLNRG